MTLSRQHRVLKYASLEGSALLLLLIIALHANDQGVCWPSTKLLAIETRLTRRRVQQLLRELQEAGFIRLAIGDARGKLSQIYISDFAAEEAALAASEENEQKPKRGRKRRQSASEAVAQSAPDFATSSLHGEIQRPGTAKSSASQTEHFAKSGVPINVKFEKFSVRSDAPTNSIVAKPRAPETAKVAKSSAQIAKHRVHAIAKSRDLDGEILSHARIERQDIQSKDPKDNNNRDIEKAECPATKSQAEGEISSQPSLYFELLSWITGWRGEQLTDTRRGQIEEAVEVLQAAGYTEQELRDYWNTVWRKDWRYLKDGRRPHINDVRAGIGVLHFTGDKIPDFCGADDASDGYLVRAESENTVNMRPVVSVDGMSSPQVFPVESAATRERDHSPRIDTPPSGAVTSEASQADASDQAEALPITEKKPYVVSDEQRAEMHELLAKAKASVKWDREWRREERKRGH